jgi:hypothetical protein
MELSNIFPIAIILAALLIVILGVKIFKIAKKIILGIIIIALIAAVVLYFVL